MKDEAAGEIPVAFVVRSNGSKITEDDIKQYISKQVIIFFFLKILYIICIQEFEMKFGFSMHVTYKCNFYHYM